MVTVRRRRVAKDERSSQDSPNRDTSPSRRYLNAWWNGSSISAIEVGADGQRRVRRINSEHSCFLRASDVDRDTTRELHSSRAVLGSSREGDWVRVRWKNYHVRKIACQAEGWFAKREIETFEGDVSPVARWMADNDIDIARPRRAYVDLETDSRLTFAEKEKMRVLVWCIVDAETGETQTGVLEEDNDEAEHAVLTELFRALQAYDQALAWNGDFFDFVVLKARARAVGLKVNFKRWLLLDHLVLFRRMNITSSESGDEKQSMALNAVAGALGLGGKDDFDASKTYEAWEAGGEELERLVRYCMRDTDLMRQIEAKTGYAELHHTLAEVCHVFPDSRGLKPQRQVDAFMLRLGRDRGIRFATKYHDDADYEPFRGAYVMEPTQKGILHDVHVADFKSLYPSIILSWNMSPEMKADGDLRIRAWDNRPTYLHHQKKPEPRIPDGACKVPITDIHFKTAQAGILPEAVETMLQLRKSWNDKKASLPPGTEEWKAADRRSTAYKIAANSFYGVMGANTSRFFDREVAESVSQAGVWLIKETLKAAERAGLVAVYGDTDSVFVRGCTRHRFEQFVAECNADLYPKLLADLQCGSNRIVLDYEKEFERIIIVTKKRYAGKYSHFKGKAATAESKPEVKGLEYKRGDTVKLCRVMQEQMVNRLLSDDDGWDKPETYVALVEEWVERILSGELDLAEVSLSKSLSKPLKEYKRRKRKDQSLSRNLPHVEIARKLLKDGKDIGVGGRVRYFCYDASTDPKDYRHASEWDGTCDRFELWEKMVWPASRRLLQAAFPGWMWGTYDRVRPRRARQRKGESKGQRLATKIVDGQATLFD